MSDCTSDEGLEIKDYFRRPETNVGGSLGMLKNSSCQLHGCLAASENWTMCCH